jgi:hypothetical protein
MPISDENEDDALIDVGTEDANEASLPLEEKYRDQMRQIVSQKIELPISTLLVMIKEQIDLSPSFQRRGIWDRERQSRFIESIIMNVPVPPVFLGEDEYGKYVVLDGRQRLTALSQFLKNAYALKGLSVWEDLNNSTFLDLEKKKLASAITRRFIPAVVLLRESSPQVKYDVFDRLNTGGVKAEPMEIRNAIYGGPFTTLLHQLADTVRFRELWKIPLDDEARLADATYRRMDDLEIILRFFALADPDSMSLKFRDYLGDFMQMRNKEYGTDPTLRAKDRALFMTAMENSWIVFGDDAFRRPTGAGALAKQKSVPLADAITIALAKVPTPELTPPKVAAIRDALTFLCTESELFQKAIGTGTNGKQAIRTRVNEFRGKVDTALQG